MEEAISINNIRIHQHARDWQEAIEIGGDILLEQGEITGSYIEEMIKSVKTLGPYIVLMPYLALAHAAPGSYVRKPDISLAIFDNDIRFGSKNDPVRVLLCLACQDPEDHIERIRQISRKLMEPDIVSALCSCKSVEDAYNLMNR